jgi:hypothetical protein
LSARLFYAGETRVGCAWAPRRQEAQDAWDTEDMLKSPTRQAGIDVRVK